MARSQPGHPGGAKISGMTRRQKAISLVVVLAVASLAAAVTLNVGWIVINARSVTSLIWGIVFFAIVIAGIILYTVFLVLEIERNEDVRKAFLGR